jgi:hypothetical protein
VFEHVVGIVTGKIERVSIVAMNKGKIENIFSPSNIKTSHDS